MEEKAALERLIKIEDILEKKAGIYGKLLTEPALAQAMEKVATSHRTRKERLQTLLGVKEK